jgi:hypothetical protein
VASTQRQLGVLLAAADEAYQRARILVFDHMEPRQVFDESALDYTQLRALEDLRVVEQMIRDHRARTYGNPEFVPGQVAR